ncbi:sensor histidine kinase [Mucilaginibacter pineti]|nr:ATP-binding protein [Mucilaginibacter pineti]
MIAKFFRRIKYFLKNYSLLCVASLIVLYLMIILLEQHLKIAATLALLLLVLNSYIFTYKASAKSNERYFGQIKIFTSMAINMFRQELRANLSSIAQLRRHLSSEGIDEKQPGIIAKSLDLITDQALAILDNPQVFDWYLTRQKAKKNIMPIDSASWITEMKILTCCYIHSRKINLITEVHQNVGKFEGDLVRINQIVFNLILGAVRFANPGSDIKLLVERVLYDIQFEVSFTSNQLLPENPESMFEYQLKDFDKINGDNFGLSTARSLAKFLNGKAGIICEGKKSRLILTLPLERRTDDFTVNWSEN